MFSSEIRHETVIPVASPASSHRTVLLFVMDKNVFSCSFVILQSIFSHPCWTVCFGKYSLNAKTALWVLIFPKIPGTCNQEYIKTVAA